jgi:hypothetical protein
MSMDVYEAFLDNAEYCEFRVARKSLQVFRQSQGDLQSTSFGNAVYIPLQSRGKASLI